MATAVINIDVKSQSLDQLEQKLAALQQRIKAVPAGSVEFTKLTKEFQAVQKQVDLTNAKIRGLNTETLAGGLAKIAGGVGAGFTALNLLLGDTTDETKALVNAQTALVTVLGLGQVAEAAFTIATFAQTVALTKQNKELVTNIALTEARIAAQSSGAASEAALKAAVLATGGTFETLKNSASGADAVLNGVQVNLKKTKGGFDILEAGTKNVVGTLDAASGTLSLTGKAAGAAATEVSLLTRAIAFLTSPITLVVAAIGALVAITFALQRQFENSARIAQYGQEVENLDDTIKSVTSNFEKSLQAIVAYNALVASGTLSADEYAAAQKQVSKSLLEAGVSQEELNRILADGIIQTEEYVDILLKQIQVQVAIDQIKKSVQDLVAFQADSSAAAPGFWQTLGNQVLSFGDITRFIFLQLETQVENSKEKTQELTDRIKKSVEIAKNLANDPELKGIFEGALFGPGGAKGLEKDAKTADDILLQAQRRLKESKIKLSKEGFDEEEALARFNNQTQIEDARKKNAEIQKDDAYSAAEKAKANQALNAEIQAANNNLSIALNEISKKRLAQSIADAKALLEQFVSDQEDLLRDATTVLEAQSTEATLKIEKANEDARAKRLAGDKTAIVKSQEEITIAILEEEKKRLEEIVSLTISSFKTREQKIADERKTLEGKTDKESIERLKELNKQEEDLADEKYQYIIAKDNEIANKELQIEKAKNDKKEKDNKETEDAIEKDRKERLERLLKAYEAIGAAIDGLNNFFQERANRQITSIQIQLEQTIEDFDKQLEDLDKTQKKRIDDLNKSEVLGERAKANAIKQIEEKAERDRLELEKKKEEAQKQAKKKELEVQIKALDVAITAQIGQAIVSAASGIATATAQAPLTFGASLLYIAPIAAALAGAIAAYTQQRASLKEQINALGFADGGYVSGPGTSRSDSIQANLSNGEFVVNAQSTSRNLPLLQAINSTNGNSGVDMAVILSELKDEIASLKTKPIKTYVVTSDLAAAQQTESYIARRAQI